MAVGKLSPRQLNRATLARQRLLERRTGDVVSTVAELGALQAQDWGAPPVALWSRLAGFAVDDLYGSLSGGELVVGSLLRGTIHLVTAVEHATYATVASEAGHGNWRRVTVEPGPLDARLRSGLRRHLRVARGDDELVSFLDAWAAAHPAAIDAKELDFQRSRKWRHLRSTCDVVRVPANGVWSSRKPSAYLTAPAGATGAPSATAALAAVARRHLSAFGPAGVEDVAAWTGLKPAVAKSTVESMDDLVRYVGPGGRPLYDVPGAPLPDADIAAPVRFLPQFDNTMLAYASKNKNRVLPDEHRAKVYTAANLRYKPTLLVDGFVAGVWASEVKRGTATVAVTAFGSLDKTTVEVVRVEGEALARFLAPKAKSHAVTVSD